MDKLDRAILSQTVDINEILGKRVLASDGEPVGTVRSLRVDPFTLSLDLIVVNTDGQDLFIGKNYIDKISDAVQLSMVPWEVIRGKEVYDSRGRLIGTIRDVHRIGTTNKVDTILVHSNRKNIEVAGRHVDHIGDTVGLNIPIEA